MCKGIEKFNELVQSLAKLPSIGKKTAMRLAYHICTASENEGIKLAHDIEHAIRFIKPCKQCGFLSENQLCHICTSEERTGNLLCIVQSPKDILIIEQAKSYEGLYYVLDELSDEKIMKLRQMIVRVKSKEIIFALTHSIHSDATIFYIEEKIQDLNLQFTQIAQGIPNGVRLENVDLISLNKALNFRVKRN